MTASRRGGRPWTPVEVGLLLTLAYLVLLIALAGARLPRGDAAPRAADRTTADLRADLRAHLVAQTRPAPPQAAAPSAAPASPPQAAPSAPSASSASSASPPQAAPSASSASPPQAAPSASSASPPQAAPSASSASSAAPASAAAPASPASAAAPASPASPAAPADPPRAGPATAAPGPSTHPPGAAAGPGGSGREGAPAPHQAAPESSCVGPRTVPESYAGEPGIEEPLGFGPPVEPGGPRPVEVVNGTLIQRICGGIPEPGLPYHPPDRRLFVALDAVVNGRDPNRAVSRAEWAAGVDGFITRDARWTRARIVTRDAPVGTRTYGMRVRAGQDPLVVATRLVVPTRSRYLVLPVRRAAGGETVLILRLACGFQPTFPPA